MGGQTPRVEWAVLSVNGEYFGFYSLEEHVSEAFFECQGWDVGASSLFKAANPTDGTRWHQTGSRALGGFESKMPDSHPRSAWSRDLDQLFTVMSKCGRSLCVFCRSSKKAAAQMTHTSRCRSSLRCSTSPTS